MHFELKKLVFEKCMSLREFSIKYGINYTTVFEIANNKRHSVRVSTIEKMCRALDCTPNDLIKLDWFIKKMIYKTKIKEDLHWKQLLKKF